MLDNCEFSIRIRCKIMIMMVGQPDRETKRKKELQRDRER